MKILAANWKMYKTRTEAQVWVKRVFEKYKPKKIKIVVFPSAPLLDFCSSSVKNKKLFLVGAQNISWEKEGALTGEISALQVKDCGADYVLIGHSERRYLFNEGSETVRKKIHQALVCGLQVVLCLGETEEIRQQGGTEIVLEKQLRGALEGIGAVAKGWENRLMIAYEPVWAIGTGRVAQPEDIQKAHRWIATLLKEHFENQKPSILYGGSVNPDNIKELAGISEVGGFLVGGASLDPKKFLSLAQTLEGLS